MRMKILNLHEYFIKVKIRKFTARKRPRDNMNDFFALKFTLVKSKSNKIVFKSNGAILASYSLNKSFCNRCISFKFSLIGDSLFPLTSFSQS